MLSSWDHQAMSVHTLQLDTSLCLRCLGTPNAIIMAAFQLAHLLSCRVKSTHPLDPCVFQALKSQLSPALHPSRILPRLQSQCPGIRTVPPILSWLQFPQYSVSPLKCSIVWKEWFRKWSSNFNTRAINQIMPDYSASILEERKERGQAENELERVARRGGGGRSVRKSSGLGQMWVRTHGGTSWGWCNEREGGKWEGDGQ